MEMLFTDNVTVREISNGMLFFASAFLCVPLCRYLLRHAGKTPIWRASIDVRLVWAMLLFVFGSALRAGWIWISWISVRHDWREVTAIASGASAIGYVAAGIMFWGLFCTMKTIRQAREREPRFITSRTAFLVALAILIPVLVRLS